MAKGKGRGEEGGGVGWKRQKGEQPAGKRRRRGNRRRRQAGGGDRCPAHRTKNAGGGWERDGRPAGRQGSGRSTWKRPTRAPARRDGGAHTTVGDGRTAGAADAAAAAAGRPAAPGTTADAAANPCVGGAGRCPVRPRETTALQPVGVRVGDGATRACDVGLRRGRAARSATWVAATLARATWSLLPPCRARALRSTTPNRAS